MFKISELIKATGGRLLSGEGDSLSGVSIDSRTIREGDLFIAIKGNRFDGHDFIREVLKKRAGAVIIDKFKEGIYKSTNIPVIKVSDTIKALGDIAAFRRKTFNLPTIGITGSNGKTTTKEMIAWILKDEFRVLKNPGTQNNQIGLPMTMLKLNKNFDIVVLEMGTNHFGEIGYLTKIVRPTIGIINNIGLAHLEFLNNLEGVYREKSALVNNLISPSIAILNMDDRFLRRNSRDKNKFVIGFGIENNADYNASKIIRKKGSIEFLVNSRYRIELNTIGISNIYNALAAISVARLFGLDYNIIVRRLSDFKFPASRLAFITTGNINFIDDTYNSNPASLEQALDTLDNLKIKGRKIFVMGDMLELGDGQDYMHRMAGGEIAKVCDILITVGKLTRLASQKALQSGLGVHSVYNCNCSKEARAILLKRVKPNKNDVVLVKGSRLMRMEEVIR